MCWIFEFRPSVRAFVNGWRVYFRMPYRYRFIMRATRFMGGSRERIAQPYQLRNSASACLTVGHCQILAAASSLQLGRAQRIAGALEFPVLR